MSQKEGTKAECIARDYLLSQGLQWRTSNYRSRMGEIDLIMQQGDYVVFVEVRARRSSTYGGAIESITPTKRQKIIKTAVLYLQQYKLYDRYVGRFDVLALQGQPPTIHWIPNAFTMDE
ncbi:MAG: YraN family protein [Legionella sp.]|nr:MAG: YraN family protein [Legionella sp.]